MFVLKIIYCTHIKTIYTLYLDTDGITINTTLVLFTIFYKTISTR